MAIKKIIDTPIWVPSQQLPVATSAVASFCSTKDTTGRYTFYLQGTTFYKYDTWTELSIKLASPPVAAVTASSIKYSAQHGYYGNCLAATSTTMTIAGLYTDVLVGQEIEITGGTGTGQVKTISSVAGPVILDTGVVTAAAATSLTDTTKRWGINQFVGYKVRVVYGTGTSQIRKVLYNNENTLYFQDNNYQQLEVWNNTAFSATAPYALPVATAGLQANYSIEQSVITLDSAWTVTPDSSSTYVIKGGGIFMISSTAAAPWSSFQYYDCLSDTWTTKTALGGLLTAALGTGFEIEIIDKTKTYLTGTATSGGVRTLTSTALSLAVDRYVNFELRITGGTGLGQKGRIVSNSATSFEIEKPWATNPDATSTFAIYGNTNVIWLSGNGASSIYQYYIDKDIWYTGPYIDFGQSVNISAAYKGQEPFGVTTGVRNTGGITTLNPTPTAAGTGYAVGDVFNITTGGTVGKGRVEAVNPGGIVTSVSLYSAGLNYTVASGLATTNVTGTGTGLTVAVTAVGVVGRITTAVNHNLVIGDQITFAGCTEGLWNAAYTVLATDSLTTFDVATTATATMVASSSQSTTVLVDASKNWAVNEHIGKIIKIDVAGPAPTTQLRRITANTAKTITVGLAITAPINGTSRYVITQPQAFGRERLYESLTEISTGTATGGTTTTLVDTGKAWFTNQWATYRIRIVAGTGVGSEFAITSNTANTLTYTAPGFTADSTTKYEIMATCGTATAVGATTTLTDAAKNWPVNIFAGKTVVFTSGTGQRQAAVIASNTATVLTFAAVTVAPDTNTTYTILALAPRSTGTALIWAYNVSETATAGNFLYCPRGGATTIIDRYDITLDQWFLSVFYSPQSITFTTGTSWVYDAADTIYIVSGQVASDFIQVYALNIPTLVLSGAGQLTTTQGVVHLGCMAMFSTNPTGEKVLFVAICTSRLLYKGINLV